jgi:twitching motility protein PilT
VSLPDPFVLDDPDTRLADRLVAGGHLAPDKAARLLTEAARDGQSLVVHLSLVHALDQAVVAETAAAVAGLKVLPPARLRPTADALLAVPPALARATGGLPVGADAELLVVAFAAPPSTEVLEALAVAAGRAVVPVIAELDALSEAARAAYANVPAPPSPSPLPRPPVPSAVPTSPAAAVPVPPAVTPAVTPALAPAVTPAVDAAAAGGLLHLDQLLLRMLDLKGSDLHITAGTRPSVRVHGVLRPLEDFPVLDPASIERLIGAILTPKQRAAFEEEMELDLAYAIENRSRFRVNVFRQRGSIGSVLRTIPFVIPEFATLGLPPVVASFADLPRGLVLVTGPTGSGKSTTLASLLDIVNRTKAVHIVSVEDPIEFLHKHKRGIVNQREVGQDTHSFAAALKRVLREDPDVILVGEMRDLETIHMALTAAETGHLVFATLHTQSAPQTVERIVDVFPPEQQGQIRIMLASTLQAVVTQQLVPVVDGKGRAVAAEVLVATSAVRNLIREAKGYQIATQMQAGAQHGMVTMDQSLAGLVRAGRISVEMAAERAANPDELRHLLHLGPSATAGGNGTGMNGARGMNGAAASNGRRP